MIGGAFRLYARTAMKIPYLNTKENKMESINGWYTTPAGTVCHCVTDGRGIVHVHYEDMSKTYANLETFKRWGYSPTQQSIKE